MNLSRKTPLPCILLFFAGCDRSIEEEVSNYVNEREEGNLSNENLINPSLEISPDGKQFKMPTSEKNVQESLGINNQGELIYKGNFKDGKPEGPWTTFFPDGKPRWKGIKRNGVNHGPFTMWYENGRKKMQGYFNAGKKHGVITSWHLNGEKWHARTYENGQPVGLWKSWDNQGKLIEETIHSSHPDENQPLGTQ